MERHGVVLGTIEGRAADIGANAQGFAVELGEQRQQESAGARAEIGDTRSSRTSMVCGDCPERCLDHRLCFGPRKKCVPANLEAQPPEFLVSQNAGDRLMRETALSKGMDPRLFRAREDMMRLGGESAVVEPQRVTHNETRVEGSAFKAVPAQLVRQ